MVLARHGLPDGTATAEKSDASRQGNRETVPRAFVDRVALPNGARLSCRRSTEWSRCAGSTLFTILPYQSKGLCNPRLGAELTVPFSSPFV